MSTLAAGVSVGAAPMARPAPNELADGLRLQPLALTQAPAVPSDPWQGPLQRLMATFKKPQSGLERDWDRFPAVHYTPEPPEELWALGDVHGDYPRAAKLLGANGLMGCVPLFSGDGVCSPQDAEWAGGNATFVQTGDVIDKGAGSIAMLHLLQRLEHTAPLQGGTVHALLGNHEASFLAKPLNAKTLGPGGIAFELWYRGIDPKKYVTDAYTDGAWLRRRPFAAVVGPFFLSHAGQSSSRSRDGLDHYLQRGVTRDGFNAPCLSGENSILRARDFAGRDGEQGPELARLMGVDFIVFGHDPDLSPKAGTIYPFGRHNGTYSLFAIDVGLTHLVDFSEGWLLHAKRTKGQYRIEACDHHGKCEELTRAPANA